METIVQDHERRIVDTEQRVKKLEENSLKMENSMLRIETAVLSEGTEQRKRMETLQDNLMTHFFGERKEIRTHKAKLAETRWTTIAGLLGAGGVGVLIIDFVLSKL